MKVKFYWNGLYWDYDYETPERFKTVDTDKYDIVEKKEAKIERLEQEIKGKTEQMNSCRKFAEDYIRKQLELDKEVEKIQKELDELKG